MNFPTWVEEPARQPRADLARKRLEFLISQAAITVVPKGSMTAFATFCCIDRTSMHAHIASGAFSAKMATDIERAVGRDVLPHEHLMRPLEINA